MVVLVEDVADDLLGDVLERDDAREPAVLVDDDGQVPVVGPNLVEHPRQGSARRHHGRFRHHRADGGARPLVSGDLQHVSDPGHADDVIAIGTGHGEARPSGVEQLDDPAHRFVGPHGRHANAGGHDVAGIQLTKAQPAREGSRKVVVEQASTVGLADDPGQVVSGRALFELLDGFDADRAQQRGRRSVEQAHDRPGQRQVEQGRAAEGPGQRHRARDREVLGRELAEDHLHDR